MGVKSGNSLDSTNTKGLVQNGEFGRSQLIFLITLVASINTGRRPCVRGISLIAYTKSSSLAGGSEHV